MIAIKTASNGRSKKRSTSPRRSSTSGAAPQWQAGYLRLLPEIYQQAGRALRHLRGEAFEDALQEVVADTVLANARLAELDKEDLAYASPLVKYAVAKFHTGRLVGNSLNADDITSAYCQRRRNVVVERLDRFNQTYGEWQEILVEDRHATPADVAAIRIDFGDWLQTLRARDRHIAETLAIGETTGRVARMFAITAGRVSQLRQEFRDSWYLFIGEIAHAEVELAGSCV